VVFERGPRFGAYSVIVKEFVLGNWISVYGEGSDLVPFDMEFFLDRRLVRFEGGF
jgi:hypothetical protein